MMKMNRADLNGELPINADRYLATIAKIYEQENKRELQALIVNADVRILEDNTVDNWNNSVRGYVLRLILPEALFLKIIKEKEKVQSRICQDLNNIHNIQDEYFSQVFIEMKVLEDYDWRTASGVLQKGKTLVPQSAQKRIWDESGFRLFLSHKAQQKKHVAELKKKLKLFGVSCFVAHEDIEPTKEWQVEIERALFSMDGFVALMCEDFHDSDWTDQEIGVAFGRGVPIICVNLGRNPYGFMGKFQALSCNWESAPMGILRILLKHEQMINSFIDAVENCSDLYVGNELAEMFSFIEKLEAYQVSRLRSVYKENSAIQMSYGFNGKRPADYGFGLMHHLKRLASQDLR